MSNFKYRLKFEKKEKMKFVGHLDLLKLFQRAVRRAKLPVHYSLGFNPHQETIFAMPLTLGMDTDYDIIDIRLTEEFDIEVMKEKLNLELPKGFKITEVRALPYTKSNCAKDLVVADYILNSKIDILNLARGIELINNMSECNIEKQSKKTNKTVNIKPDILELSLNERGLFAKIATGSKQHLKPELLHEFFCQVLGEKHSPIDLKVSRLKMYCYDDNGELCEL